MKTTTLSANRPVEPTLSSRNIESRAIYYAGISGIVAFLISFVLFYPAIVPLFGRQSIGFMVSVIASLTALVIFFLVAEQQNMALAGGKLSLYRKFHVIFTTAALAFVHAAVVFLVFAAGYFLVQDAFKGLSLDSLTASILVAVSVALSSYAVYLAAVNITTVRVSSVLALFLVSGALTSMITAENPQWWEIHFSSLGGDDSFSSAAFNITLIVAGIVIVSLSDYIANDFAKLQHTHTKYIKDKANIVRIVLALIGMFLAFVGLFAYNEYPEIHNTSAGGMAIMFIGLVLGLPWLVPSFTRAFFMFSYGLMVGLVVCYWLFVGVGYLNLTAFELIAASIIFGWLVVFVRQIAADLSDTRQAAFDEMQHAAKQESPKKATTKKVTKKRQLAS